MNKETENYIDHEVRIRLLKELNDERHIEIKNTFKRIDSRFDHLESRMDNQFKWIVGIMITMFGGLIITKLI